MTVEFFDQYAMEAIGLTIAFLTLLATLRTNIKRLLIEILNWQKNFYYCFYQKNEIEVEMVSTDMCDPSERNYTTLNNSFEKGFKDSKETQQIVKVKDNDKSESNDHRKAGLVHFALGALIIAFLINLVLASGDSFIRILKYCLMAVLVFVIIPLWLMKLVELLNRKESSTKFNMG